MLVQRLAALLTTLPKGETVRRALELDGFAVNVSKLELISLEGPVSHNEEEDRVTTLVKGGKLPSETVILEHLRLARQHYENGADHSCIGEARNFLQALIDDVGCETSASGRHAVGWPGGTANRIEYLNKVGFFTKDEAAAISAGWGSLSAGNHPGIPARHEAHIALILALEFGQMLLLKFLDWKANGYAGFSPPGR